MGAVSGRFLWVSILVVNWSFCQLMMRYGNSSLFASTKQPAVSTYHFRYAKAMAPKQTAHELKKAGVSGSSFVL